MTAIHLSRTVFRRIQLNFCWAMGYNIVGIPAAAGVFFPFIRMGLPPQFAGLAMAFSSVSVVTSSLLLRRYKRMTAAEIIDDIRMSERKWWRKTFLCQCCQCLSEMAQAGIDAVVSVALAMWTWMAGHRAPRYRRVARGNSGDWADDEGGEALVGRVGSGRVGVGRHSGMGVN